MYGALTELDAVNGMLMAIHEQPVVTLEDDGVEEMALARATLTEISRLVQAAGWHFNTVKNRKMLPATPSGEIVLPHNCLRVDTVRSSAGLDVVQRGPRLFDATHNTFIFANPVTVDMVLFLPFDELIQPARDYIQVRATRRFQARVMGSQMVEYFTEREEGQVYAILHQAELENADYNLLSGSPLSRYTVSRDRGY